MGNAETRKGTKTMTPNEEWGLAGKVAIVIGGGAVGDGIGNGREACILLARAGAHVMVVDQRPGTRRTHRCDDRRGGREFRRGLL